MMHFHEETARPSKAAAVFTGLALLGLCWAAYKLGYLIHHS